MKYVFHGQHMTAILQERSSEINFCFFYMETCSPVSLEEDMPPAYCGEICGAVAPNNSPLGRPTALKKRRRFRQHSEFPALCLRNGQKASVPERRDFRNRRTGMRGENGGPGDDSLSRPSM